MKYYNQQEIFPGSQNRNHLEQPEPQLESALYSNHSTAISILQNTREKHQLPPTRQVGESLFTPDWAHSRTDLERQAEAHELLGQGQENYPTYHYQLYQPFNPTHQSGHAGPNFTNQQPYGGHFSPVGPAFNSLSSPYPQPPCSVGYQPFPGNFPPNIP